MRKKLSFGLLAGALLFTVRPADALPITVQIGEFVYTPGDDFIGTSPFATIFNMTGFACADPLDPTCLPTALRNQLFAGVAFSFDDAAFGAPIGDVDLSADYQTFDLAASNLDVQFSFLGQLLSPFELGIADPFAESRIALNFTFESDTPPAPVPEPGTLLLLGGGLVTLLSRRRSQQRSKDMN